jgi:hypothetical protein
MKNKVKANAFLHVFHSIFTVLVVITCQSTITSAHELVLNAATDVIFPGEPLLLSITLSEIPDDAQSLNVIPAIVVNFYISILSVREHKETEGVGAIVWETEAPYIGVLAETVVQSASNRSQAARVLVNANTRIGTILPQGHYSLTCNLLVSIKDVNGERRHTRYIREAPFRVCASADAVQRARFESWMSQILEQVEAKRNCKNDIELVAFANGCIAAHYQVKLLQVLADFNDSCISDRSVVAIALNLVLYPTDQVRRSLMEIVAGEEHYLSTLGRFGMDSILWALFQMRETSDLSLRKELEYFLQHKVCPASPKTFIPLD